MYAKTGPQEDTPEARKLADKQGFKYRSLLGELMYAYASCRPDIGYAVVTLSKFANCPSELHYTYLKGVAKYLRTTIHWHIRYRRRTPDTTLPHAIYETLSPDEFDKVFPDITSGLALRAYTDAAHANDLRNRRSQTGHAIALCGGVVAYRSKTQSVTATSSTEAEFVAAVSTAKTVRHPRAAMKDLGFPMDSPTPIYEDNVAAINIVNARRPTERSRHIDIQCFALQDWKEAGDVIMHHIPGVINPADDLTKPLGWVPHSRHARRFMGHYA